MRTFTLSLLLLLLCAGETYARETKEVSLQAAVGVKEICSVPPL